MPFFSKILSPKKDSTADISFPSSETFKNLFDRTF